jgi:co-chaperonin GroES (HSP10)
MIYSASEVQPYHDMVLVRRIDTAITPSGLILPQVKDKESNLAVIVAVGPGIPGKEETKPLCNPGEFWLISRFIGTKVDLDNKEHILVTWRDCQAKVIFPAEALKLLDQSLNDN